MIPSQEIKKFLDTLGTLGPIRIGNLDPTPDVLGAVFEYGGRSAEGRFGVVGVGYERPAISIIFRGIPNDYLGPMTKARIAWQALASVQPGLITLGSALYLSVKPQGSPFSLGQDPTTKRFEISCNYYIEKEPS